MLAKNGESPKNDDNNAGFFPRNRLYTYQILTGIIQLRLVNDRPTQ